MQIKTDKASISLPHSDLVVLSVSLLLEYPTINYPPFFMINHPEPMQNAKEAICSGGNESSLSEIDFHFRIIYYPRVVISRRRPTTSFANHLNTD